MKYFNFVFFLLLPNQHLNKKLYYHTRSSRIYIFLICLDRVHVLLCLCICVCVSECVWFVVAKILSKVSRAARTNQSQLMSRAAGHTNCRQHVGQLWRHQQCGHVHQFDGDCNTNNDDNAIDIDDDNDGPISVGDAQRISELFGATIRLAQRPSPVQVRCTVAQVFVH